ncbi:MAG: imidazolonepropionase [Spirochaetae bacterium HGW-Spirochaetae-3]|jgi:imidazolonepropionase|nr:MAG: imidazolonepropionase [Spirochaetae bacterium HGW-Spirochaetae-3]
MKATLVIGNIGELATPTGSSARRGAGMSELRVVRDAAVAIDVETIVWAGPAREMPPVEGPAPEFVDAGGRAVVPGIVDSHTHFVFGGYRAEEFYWRAAGLPYMEIHARGGGIANTVRDTRSASLDDLLASATPRLERMLELGITTVEGKSGYGLDLDTEIRQLEAMRVLDARQPVDIVATYMGPHSIPTEYKDSPSGYIDFILRDVLPRVRERGLARFCDVFCEEGVFGLEDSRRFLEAARDAGFGLKLHADEIVRIGGAGLAAAMGAASADHLLKASGDDLDAMARAGVVATCLPVTAFTLREPYADARGMIDRGLAVALASDLNPGSCYSQSIPLVAALGVLYMNMSIEEVLTALTLNGAAAVGQAGDRGSIEPGKIADALILDAPSFRHLAYNAGMNIVDTVIKRGKVVSVRN